MPERLALMILSPGSQQNWLDQDPPNTEEQRTQIELERMLLGVEERKKLRHRSPLGVPEEVRPAQVTIMRWEVFTKNKHACRRFWNPFSLKALFLSLNKQYSG